ncbi:ABC transporter permease subunit [Halostella pelagica]|uniref:ABC transporter permease subunit n=1 Tax=Halostella pelagica TaxID=2583824 RepID=UPI001080A05C|nr:ABC transporter permease subunit [Halostella pelagica]
MTWSDIAYKDVNDAGRSKTIWLLFGLLLVLSVGYAYLHRYVGEEAFSPFITGLSRIVGVGLPLLAILLGYKSIIHERSSGSLLLTLSLPHDRRDLAVGTFVGRSLVLLVPTLVALVVAGAAGAAFYGTDGLATYPWFLFATALYGLSFVGIAVGLSMSTTVDRWVTFGALGGYLLLVTFWEAFHSVTLLLLHRFDFTVLTDLPDWALLFRLVEPWQAYNRLLRFGVDTSLASRYVGDGVPVYVDWWMGIVLLVAWTCVPLALGFYRFSRSDL